MSTLPKTQITPGQYLEIERRAEFKSEYRNGEMFAMAGASRNHNDLVSNLQGPQFRDRNCRGMSNDMSAGWPQDVRVEFLDEHGDVLLNLP